MIDILIKSMGFILIICLGYLLKVKRFLSLEDGKAISRLVINVTLPCALILSTREINVSAELFILLFVGFFSNCLLLFLGYMQGRHFDSILKGQSIIQLAGFNVGNFAFPFVQSFFPIQYGVSVILFDIGNAIMVFGGNYALSSSISGIGEKLSFRGLIKTLLHSVPFCTYLVCFILSLLKWTIPDSIVSVIKLGADANPFLAMLSLGTMVDLSINKSQIKELFQLLASRLLLTFLIIAILNLLPISSIAKEMVTICLLAPIAVVTPIFAQKLGSSSSTPANVSTLSIFSSILLMMIAILVFH
ncbi:hypothetical protein HMPREF9318_01359 [Streptococcus urinalis FB127-CNA-2]|uniref:Membrane protein n=1 Tax=Streptococcus urinalis 2285-97 TaxID=764291 RepID=G5KD19_9STRE|nr:hypothetical protein [Streptococcus urinalis]EHJ56117.1 putative membrane protein [Streptococcus urinalis 2285-97]EKS19283.1 hypothetical protein HMPREF9318_01359 [Streptococcus urinalis FB127-CNA-2]VEF31414.1 transporter protein [Streptococcus urinalis]